ncbi:Formate-tetrahydrofolate ligase, FTHFS domain protein, partial [Candidatus Magnetobacterium bavaricum]
MPLEPTKHADWEIAEAAEANMKQIYQLAEESGLEKEELLQYGHYVGKIDFKKVLSCTSGRPDGKYADVKAITPTPLGEGNSTTMLAYQYMDTLTQPHNDAL